ncbi:MAG: PAS domain-containing protein [Thermoanaerobaculia bacterium]|nr:PAS domain-containing protein [Thermoanaerobaculia bacterium]
MRLRSSYFVHLAAVHLAVLGIAAWKYEFLGPWFFVIEAAVLASWLCGVWLARRSLQPVAFVQSFSDLLREREFSARFSPVGQAEMDRLIEAYNRMLTDLYEERQRLGEQRGFLEQFVQASPLGVIILDYDGRITLVNPAAARLLERDADEIAGRELDSLGSEFAEVLRTLRPGENRLLTWRSMRRLRLEKMVFVDRGFSRQFVLIEELTRVIDESERAAYEKLIRLMSHEVNNTVAATNSLLQSCSNYASQIAPEDRGDFANALRVVIERNEGLNRFMGDFAQVVRLPEPEKQLGQLSKLLESLEIMFGAQCRERSIRWVRNYDEEVPRVAFDREQMEQVLINILKNAIEAIGDHGSLEIRLSEHGGAVELEILDDGGGLDLETQGSLFSPFFSTKAQGQGLGLTLAKEILVKHGFEFGLEPAADGRTRFHLRIPLKATR